MDLLPGVPLPLTLLALALVDSLSIGTLLIPLFLLVAPGRVRASRVLVYLSTIAAFYCAVGALVLLGAVNLAEVAQDALVSPPGRWGRLIIGVALVIVAFAIPTKTDVRATVTAATATADDAASAADHPSPGPGRLSRWRDRLLDPTTRKRGVVAVAAGAGIIEVATMLPYLLAISVLASSDLSSVAQVTALVGYCVIMILPATLLLFLRVLAHRVLERPLQRMTAWLQRTAAENTAWIIGIVGFLIARDAISDLGGLGFLG
ncbi:Sap-like sulfolipid-1-addressing protein [Microbacterium sp. SLBN-154]|uniref:GAP family protein n=1 Tax=Microbacterium sp. SLBN-154 TaxID=2768458 RepID=UPI00115320CC|nr:GAP family protein [Microbacterium sp. SLBN-154]TQK18018.1 Sap-like sulfolipid-1-addressing protein [Microbacterium sp. SLBN-154]